MRAKEFLLTENLIGPHEQQEISLMLAGKKPAALLGMTPEIKKLVKQGKIKAFKSNTHKGKQYFLTLPGEENRAKKLDIAFGKLFSYVKNHELEKEMIEHIKIGKLLGYSEKAIKHFVKRNYPIFAKELSKNLQS